MQCFGCMKRAPLADRRSCQECSDRHWEENRIKTLRRLGITQEQFDALLRDQEHACKICRAVFTPRGRTGPCIDHDHVTGRVRGLLCSRCNFGLGHFRDDPDLLTSAAKYLHAENPLTAVGGTA